MDKRDMLALWVWIAFALYWLVLLLSWQPLRDLVGKLFQLL
jgi:hypothetical protein